MLSTVSTTASAQFGLLKKLGKHKADSAARDSTAVANGAIAPAAVTPKVTTTPDSVAAATPAADTTKKHHSFFGKALSAVGKANSVVQDKTGIDTKSLALNVATAGTYSAVTKAQSLIAAANSGNPAAAAAAALGQSGHKLPLGVKLGVATALTAITPNIGSAFGGTPATAKATGSTSADQLDVMAFQQEMLQVQSQAANGDAGARARLEQWQAISVKYQPQMIEATQRASAGDQKAVKQLADLQMKMIREWRAGGGASSSKP
ncbi:MAG TPA: hypothetical protein VJO52_03870 [Gemmatimonadaceae bacterium]|nr:hypothetical protein [Gemmatimonadaceae bacterium]